MKDNPEAVSFTQKEAKELLAEIASIAEAAYRRVYNKPVPLVYHEPSLPSIDTTAAKVDTSTNTPCRFLRAHSAGSRNLRPWTAWSGATGLNLTASSGNLNVLPTLLRQKEPSHEKRT
jgi:hypothetical protein